MSKKKPKFEFDVDKVKRSEDQIKSATRLSDEIQKTAQKALVPMQTAIEQAKKHFEISLPSLNPSRPIEIDLSHIYKKQAEEAELRKLMLKHYRKKPTDQAPAQNIYQNNIQFLVLTADGGFKYKGKYLIGLSTDSQEGQLLVKFLEDKEHFLSGLDRGFEFYRYFGFVLRNLKKAFRKNGLEAIIVRRKKTKGYIFMDIEELKKRKIRVKT